MEIVLWLKRSLWAGLGLPRCKRLAVLMSQSMDRKLSLRERLLLRSHYILCDRCYRYSRHLDLMREAVQSGQDEAEDRAALSPETRHRIKRLLSEQSGH